MKPLLLLSRGHDDADFLYACHFAVEQGLYLRFEGDDDLLAVSMLELDRARREGRARRILDRDEAGWTEQRDTTASWVDLARRLVAERGFTEVRVSPLLPAAVYVGLREAGVEPEIDHGLFLDERRRKSAEEADCIRAAQAAAEAACVEVIGQLAAAEAQRDGLLWLDGSPLTSERLMARAQAALNEIGYGASEMIVAGSPECALPHFRGEGQLRANAPIIIDIFPRGKTSGYHGDLTRTVVVGQVPDEVRRMWEACCAALDASVAMLKAGVNGRDVHREACRVLVEHGFGSYTKGFEGREDGPRMSHSLGHGVGLEVHEAPSLGRVGDDLVPGDVIALEPGVYRSGYGGVRLEDIAIVTDDGIDVVTEYPYDLAP